MDSVTSVRCQLRGLRRLVSMATVWWVLLLVTLSFLFHALLIQRPDTLPQLNQQLQALRETYFSQSQLSLTQGSNVEEVDAKEVVITGNNNGTPNDSLSEGQINSVSETQIIENNNTDINNTISKKSPKQSWKLLPHRGKNFKKLKNKGKGKSYAFDEVMSVNWTKEMSQAREAVYEDRAAAVDLNCRQLRLEGFYQAALNKIHNNLRWDDHHDLVWCPIFKAASTTWVKNFLILAGEMKLEKSLHGEVNDVFAAPRSQKKRMLQLKKSLKMLIVRHPLDRLLSAYRDKMLRAINPGDPYVGLQVCLSEKYPDLGPNDKFREYESAKLCSTGVDDELKQELKGKLENITHPTFTQFLLKVRDDMHFWQKNPDHIKVNLHWRPYWTHCGPCKVKYDVIMHTESLDLDNEYVIHKAGLEGIIFNAHTHASKFDAYNDTSESTKAYYSKVPLWLLKDIINLYQPDLTIFGYSAQPYLNIVSSSHSSNKDI